MPLSDFGALSVFGIDPNSSTSVCTDYSKYSEWKTTYYRENTVVGRARSTSYHPLWNNIALAFYKWNTTYCDSNGHEIGTSLSVGKDFCSKDLEFREWETTYYAKDETTVIATSKSSKPVGERAKSYDWVTHYSGSVAGISLSVGRDWVDPMFRKWETIYLIPKLFVNHAAQQADERKKAEQSARDARDASSHANYERVKRFHEEANRIKNEQISAARQSVTIPELKRYYVSRTCFFNASSKIFNSDNLDKVLQVLESRARSNPGGSSDKTLKRFNLK